MSSDGASLNTLVKLSPDDETMLLVLLNSVGDVFGALVTEPWKKKMSNHFYGTGTCNVWSFHQGEELQLYPGTGVNEYYILVSEQYFAMGSGGNFAIYLVSYIYHTSLLRHITSFFVPYRIQNCPVGAAALVKLTLLLRYVPLMNLIV